MHSKTDRTTLDRRGFLKTSAVAAAGAGALMSATGQAEETRTGSFVTDEGLDYRNHRPDRMPYRKLGRTNFMCSRLVFGCGAALAGGRAVHLLEHAYEAGINHYDVGYDAYYRGSEKHLAPFVKKYRDDVWVTSKAPARLTLASEVGEELTVEQGKIAAKIWTQNLEDSLKNLQMDYVDAYYLMAVDNPAVMRSEEIYGAFENARDAGKVKHFGFSSHKRADENLEAAIDTGWYDLAMIAITPGGWYDWDSKQLLEGTKTMTQLRPLLTKAQESGIGLVCMKAARYIAPATALGKNVPDAFDKYYSKAMMDAGLTPFQRTYIYVLQNGMDVANADMQNIKHFEDNVAAVQKAHLFEA